MADHDQQMAPAPLQNRLARGASDSVRHCATVSSENTSNKDESDLVNGLCSRS